MASKGVKFRVDGEYKAGSAFRQAQRDMQNTRRAADEAGRGMQSYAARTSIATVANKRFAQSIGGSTWRRQVQQAGMQVSDFAVQVAGGQSAILAFTQNAPQFVQNFGAIGGVLAAGITILGTMAFSWAKARGAAKSFDDQIVDTTKTLDEYFALVRRGGGVTAEAFKKAETQLSLTSQAAKDLLAIAKIEAFQGIEKLNESLVKSAMNASVARTQLGDVVQLLGATDAEMISAQLGGSAGDEIREFYNELIRLREVATLDEQYRSALRLRDMFKSHVDVTGELTKRQQSYWKQLSQTIQQMELLGAAQEAETTAVERSIAAHAEYSRSRNVADQMSIRLQQQQVEKSREAHTEYARSRNVAMLLARDLETSADEMMLMSGIDITSSIASATREAAQLAVNLGVSLDAAMSLRNLQSRKQYGGRGSGVEYTGQSDYTSKVGYTSVQQMIDEFNKKQARLNKSGAKSEAQKQDEDMKKLIDEAHPQLQRMLKETKDLTLDAAKEIAKTFEDTQKTISNSMMSAFKGLLDGSKSFGEAARDILGSIMDRVIDLLMTPIFNSLAGSITGGIMNGLTGLGASFDGGGFTGAGVRAGGLDGKGGKLAMVHPNETVVDHTKGQSVGGGNTVVFNIRTPDVEGFKRSQRQLARQAKAALG